MKYLLILLKLTLLLTAATGQAQQRPAQAPAASPSNELECRVLTGRVTDPFAFPLTGATIMLRSPGKGFIPDAFSTNAEGHYMVTTKQAIPRNTIMEVTAVGYATLELPLTNCQPLDLTLTPLNSTTYKVKFRTKKSGSSARVR